MARIEKLDDVKYPARLRKKFELMTRRNPETGCLEWQGSLVNKGYGMVGITGKYDDGQHYKYLSHRVAWMLSTGEMPPSTLMLCHRCDNPACVDSEHLFPGTNADNMRDMHAKGRGPTEQAGTRVGERNGNARLTWTDIDVIRTEARNGGWGMYTRLARTYGVTPSMIGLIVQGRYWREDQRPR